jgi:hypothetical protein
MPCWGSSILVRAAAAQLHHDREIIAHRLVEILRAWDRPDLIQHHGVTLRLRVSHLVMDETMVKEIGR